MIFTEKDWKDADRLGRIYMHLVEPRKWELSYEDEDHLNRCKAAWESLFAFPTTISRVRHLADTFQMTEMSARKALDDAAKLFGNIMKLNKSLELHMSRERFLGLGKKAEDMGDYEVARRCYESADKVMAEIERQKPPVTKVYPALILTDNPAALTARNQPTDATEADILELETEAILRGNDTL